MTADRILAELAELVGIHSEFTDMASVVHKTTPETQRALLRANGICAETEAQAREALGHLREVEATAYLPADVIIAADQPHTLDVSAPVKWVVFAEDSDDVLAEGSATQAISLPAIAPGVYVAHLSGGAGVQLVTLLVTPGEAPSLRQISGQEKSWGVVAALYGLASKETQPVGTYADLGRLAEKLGELGAGFLGINPVHALGWAAPDTVSPYSPTHRGFLNSLHITSDGSSRCVNEELIDYSAFASPHRTALRTAYEAFDAADQNEEHRQFSAFCDAGGAALHSFACFEALSELYGADWRQWPAQLREPEGGARAAPDAIRFHKWLQWRADAQLAGAQAAARQGGMALGLYLDLAVGARLGGAESWGAGSACADGVSLGAPPDLLSPAGQNWQLAALSPRKLQQGHYAALRHILAQTLKHCGVLRIDHALGLNRSFWLPEDGSPGGYIRQNFRSLMAVIAIEAHRAQSVIIGEDLGLVPQGFRDTMADGGLYGYTVLQYEKDHTGSFVPGDALRAKSLACFGTHDTPTLQGFWNGNDIAWWHKLGWIDAAQAEKARGAREDEKSQLGRGLAEPRTPARVRDHIHHRLAASTAAMVAVQLDDVLLVPEAQNIPGTIDAHPNWRRRYPIPVDAIARSDDLATTARIMADAGRRTRNTKTRKESK